MDFISFNRREWLLLKDEYLTLQKESIAQMKQTKRMHYPMPIFRRGTQTKSQVCHSLSYDVGDKKGN